MACLSSFQASNTRRKLGVECCWYIFHTYQIYDTTTLYYCTISVVKRTGVGSWVLGVRRELGVGCWRFQCVSMLGVGPCKCLPGTPYDSWLTINININNTSSSTWYLVRVAGKSSQLTASTTAVCTRYARNGVIIWCWVLPGGQCCVPGTLLDYVPVGIHNSQNSATTAPVATAGVSGIYIRSRGSHGRRQTTNSTIISCFKKNVVWYEYCSMYCCTWHMSMYCCCCCV